MMDLRVRLTVRDVFVFSLCHFYKTVSGMVSIVCTAMVLGVVAASWASQTGIYRIFLMVGVVFVAICQPLMLYRKAVAQTKDPIAAKEIVYKLDYNGLKVQQGKEKATVNWNQIVKVGRLPGMTVVYLNRSRAYLFPDWAMANGRKEQFSKIVTQYVAKEKRKGI